MNFDFSNYLLTHASGGDFTGSCNCRMASYIAQGGKCYVTGQALEKGKRQMHHRKPLCCGGENTPENTVVVTAPVHRLIHSRNLDELFDLLCEHRLSNEQEHLVEQLRVEARERTIGELFGIACRKGA